MPKSIARCASDLLTRMKKDIEDSLVSAPSYSDYSKQQATFNLPNTAVNSTGIYVSGSSNIWASGITTTGTTTPWTGAWQGAMDNGSADTLRLNFLLNMINKHGTDGLSKRVNWDPSGIDRKSIDQAMEAGTL